MFKMVQHLEDAISKEITVPLRRKHKAAQYTECLCVLYSNSQVAILIPIWKWDSTGMIMS